MIVHCPSAWVSSDSAPVSSKGQENIQSLCRLSLCCENKSDTSISFPLLYPRFKNKSVSELWATARHLPSPVAKLLTPPWAENRGDTPADEFLEMFRTTKLGPVTGNLSGLVLADTSDTSLSTQEGFCFNQSPSWPQTQMPTEGLSSGVCSRKTSSLCMSVGEGRGGYTSMQHCNYPELTSFSLQLWSNCWAILRV